MVKMNQLMGSQVDHVTYCQYIVVLLSGKGGGGGGGGLCVE